MTSKATSVPNPDYLKKLKSEKDERDCQLAKEVLALAVQARAGKDAKDITDTAEAFWQWVVSD